MPSTKISDTDLRQIVSLYEMSERGSQEGADTHVRNEAVNAISALLRLLGKYGLSLGDLPQLQRQYEAATAAKAAAAASAATAEDAGPNVLELVHHVLQEWIDVAPHEYIGIALWILHAHVFNHFEVTPRLALLSPVRGCGKSNLLKFAERLTPNAARYDNITAATLFRLIDEGLPTMLLDEGDNIGLKIDQVMRRVLNGGYERGGRTSRMMNGVPREYLTFAPVAIGAIGTLPLPLMARSIVINMQRSKRDDLKTKEQLNTPEETNRLEALRQLIVAWAQNTSALSKAPKMPKILRLRAADNWRILLSIADSFGNAYWSQKAREAAAVFAAGYHDEDAPVALITDIRTIFVRRHVDRIKSLDLAQARHHAGRDRHLAAPFQPHRASSETAV